MIIYIPKKIMFIGLFECMFKKKSPNTPDLMSTSCVNETMGSDEPRDVERHTAALQNPNPLSAKAVFAETLARSLLRSKGVLLPRPRSS